MGYLSTYNLTWDPKELVSIGEILDNITGTVEPEMKKLVNHRQPSWKVHLGPSNVKGFRYTIYGKNEDSPAYGSREDLLKLADLIINELGYTSQEKNNRDHRMNWYNILGGEYETKWYEYSENMTKLSNSYPEVTFILERNGEDDDDLVKHYYKNGEERSAKAQIVFDPNPFEVA